MKRPTGSSIGRFLRCLGSHVLQQHPREGRYSAAGRSLDSYLTAVASGTEPAIALERLPSDERDFAAAVDLHSLPIGIRYEAQRSFAWDWQTRQAKDLGQHIDRAYPDGIEWICCTPDVIGWPITEQSGTAYVGDYKRGVSLDTHWDQCRLAALCMLQLDRSVTDVYCELIYFRGPNPSRKAATLTREHVKQWASQIPRRMVAAQLAAGRAGPPPTNAGEWCRHCPALPSCPTHTSLATALAGKLSETLPGAFDLNDVPALWERIKQVRRVCDSVEDACLALATQYGPVQLESGKMLGEYTPPPRESLDARVGYRVLSDVMGRDEAREYIDAKLTKTNLQKAAKVLKERHGGSVKEHADGLLELIHSAGGVRVSDPAPKIGEYDGR